MEFSFLQVDDIVVTDSEVLANKVLEQATDLKGIYYVFKPQIKDFIIKQFNGKEAVKVVLNYRDKDLAKQLKECNVEIYYPKGTEEIGDAINRLEREQYTNFTEPIKCHRYL